MSRLYDRATGQWMDVDDADVTPLVSKGTHAFESGLEIPVVSPDGQFGSIKSDNAEEAFRKGGFRWATQEDTRAWEDRKNEKILQDQYGQGNIINAGIAGGLRGFTFGASDAVAPAIAELVKPGSGTDVKSGLNQLKDRNPITSAVTQAGGALANPLLRGAGAKLAEVGGEAAALGTLARLPIGTSARAAKIVESMVGGTAGSAIEGAFYGLGDGVSEAALGDPSEIAQNLAAGTGTGALLGGAFGTSFGLAKEAAPYLKKAAGAAYQTADDLVQAGLRKSFKASVVPAISLKGEKELANIVGDLADGPGAAELRRAYMEGGAEKARQLAKDLRSTTEQMRTEMKGLKNDLNSYIKTAPKAEQQAINQQLAQANGDINAALQSTFSQHEGAKALFTDQLKRDFTPGTMFDTVHHDTQKLLRNLEKTGDAKALRKAKELGTWLDAQMSSRGILTPKAGQVSEGTEMLLTNELRDRARLGFDKLRPEVKDLLSGYIDNLTYTLRNNPKFGIEQSKLDDLYGAFDKFRGFVSNVKKSPDLTAKQSVLHSIVTDPQKAKDFDTLLNNVSEILPEFDAIKKAGKNVIERQNALRALSDKLDTFRNRSLTRGLDIDDFDEIIKAINPDGDMVSKVDKLRALQDSFQSTQNLGPASKMMAFSKALGRPVTDDLKQMLKFEQGFGQLESLKKLESQGGPLEGLAKSILGRVGLGGLIGGVKGAAFGGLSAAASNPRQALMVLTKLERASQKSFSSIEKATNAAIDALTKPSGNRARIALSTYALNNSLDKRRETFKDRADYINSLRDPHKLAAEIENKVGSLHEAPNVSIALGTQFAKTAAFLADKLPTDPLAHMSLMSSKSPWQPSDFELSVFERYSRAAENPTSVLESIAKGEAAPEEIETLKALYPSIYERLQKRVLDVIMEGSTNVSYEQRLNIGTLFGVPTDITMSPEFIASMQSQYQNPSSPAQSPQQSAKKSIHIEINPNAMATEVSRLTYQ